MNKFLKLLLSFFSILVISQISQARLNHDIDAGSASIDVSRSISPSKLTVSMTQDECMQQFGNSPMCENLASIRGMTQEQCMQLFGNSPMCEKLASLQGMTQEECMRHFGNSPMCEQLASHTGPVEIRVGMTSTQCFSIYGNSKMCERLAQQEEGLLSSNDTVNTCGNDLYKWCPSADTSSSSEVGLCLNQHKSVLSPHCARSAGIPRQGDGNIHLSQATVNQTGGVRLSQ